MYAQRLTAALLLASAAQGAPSSANKCDANPGYDTSLVLSHGEKLSTHSWEYGTASEALIELYNPSLSVFSPTAFPDDKLPSPGSGVRALDYAHQHISLYSSNKNGTLIGGDGAAGDPASLGVFAWLIGQSEAQYKVAAQKQRDYLLKTVPRFPNGAISQRDDNLEAWADFMFMVPPFLAYSAVAGNDVSLMKETVRQCKLYGDILLNTQNSSAYWRHIIPGSTGRNEDLGIWSTGNAWAAYGMARVLGTLVHWGPTAGLKNERGTLIKLIKGIVDGAMSAGCDDGLLRNYLPDTSWFGETSGTALLAAAVYRVAVIAPEAFGSKYIKWADERRAAVAKHVNKDGIMSPAVNPLGWGDRTPFTTGSPEGQSFGGMLGASYRDCVCAGVCKR